MIRNYAFSETALGKRGSPAENSTIIRLGVVIPKAIVHCESKRGGLRTLSRLRMGISYWIVVDTLG